MSYRSLVRTSFLAFVLALGAAALALTASPSPASAANNCAADFKGVCGAVGSCASIGYKDVGPTADCLAASNKTCCTPPASCSAVGGSCDIACGSNETGVGIKDCSGTSICCVKNASCASLKGSCKTSCGTGEDATSAKDCAGSFQLCCVPSGTALPSAGKTCQALGGGSCQPSITGCPDGTTDRTTDASDCGFGEYCCVASAAAPTSTAAAKGSEKGKTTASFGLKNPLGQRTVPQILGSVVSWLGTFAGGLFMLYLVWGGLEWMTARGSDEQVKKGRDKIIAAVSGIVIILLSYLIVDAIITFTSIR